MLNQVLQSCSPGSVERVSGTGEPGSATRVCLTRRNTRTRCWRALAFGATSAASPARCHGNSLSTNILSTPAISSLQCPRCFITFRDLQTSLQHPALYERRLRGRTVFTCCRCERTFPLPPALHPPASPPSGPGSRPGGGGGARGRTPRCPAVLQSRQCGAGFRNRRARQCHTRLSHPEEYQDQVLARSRLRCHLCGLPCSLSRQLIEHQHSQHPLCPRCFITFRDLQTSLQHPALYERRLRGRTVFACRRCERTFPPPASSPPTSEPTARAGKQAGRRGRGERKNAKMPTSPSLLPLPDRHKCPHCNFLFRDAKTKMRHMNVKHPTGCPLPPPLFFSTGDEEREEEEEVVMAVQVKEEDEDDFSTALRHRGNLNPASPHQGGGKEGVVKVPIKPDAGDVRTKEETIEGVCECALCGKGFEQLLAAAGQRRRGRRREHSAPRGPGATPAGTAGSCVTARRRCGSTRGCTRWSGPTSASMGAVWACHVLFGGEDCGNTFKRASGLQRHRSIHTQVLYSATASTQPAPELLPSHKSTRTVLLCGLQIQEELGEILHHNSCFPLESQHSTT
ncbi:hypothetical protein ANANG_G00005410 [Anguilla anguilla]|uniref:C2H2-type domain-containing protein n=1 Tax=Anguilla anguilla TaxID=7936 RepID=A0A9D3MYL3_ANGAN|nr:hypothetical protein ANANG_G00005410 [Anguilla anguilla]